MPILEVIVVLKEDELLPTGLAAQIANAVASILRASPGGTWVRIASLQAGLYAEDNGGPPPDVAPVFVSVLKAEVQNKQTLSQEAAELTAVIAKLTNRPPENVHIIYELPAKGRTSLGGRLVT